MTPAHPPILRRSSGPILQPWHDVPWASEMVLNPAIHQEPREPRIHMLFRATGPGPVFAGRTASFPIYLGYAWSDDGGDTWTPDLTRPALAPRLRETYDDLFVGVENSGRQLDYANGCIEDPRLFPIDGHLYLSAACRIFPPGAYWIHDDPVQCAPDWARRPGASGGAAVEKNLTVSVLYRVDLSALKARRYEEAFTYLGPLTDPDRSDNRDAFLFPERLKIDGRLQYLMVHRPKHPGVYRAGLQTPSIFLAAADTLADLAKCPTQDELLAEPLFGWEGNRIGGSTPPLRIDGRRWLLPYHGKQDDIIGYTQSFMILEEVQNSLPKVTHRCSERYFHAELDWELDGKFPIPCVFTCGAIRYGDDLLMAYGAADTVCGMARTGFTSLVEYVESFNSEGERT